MQYLISCQKGGNLWWGEVKHRWLLLHLIFAFSNQCLTAILCSQPPPHKVVQMSVKFLLLQSWLRKCTMEFSFSLSPPLFVYWPTIGDRSHGGVGGWGGVRGCDKSMMIWRANSCESTKWNYISHFKLYGNILAYKWQKKLYGWFRKNPIFSLLSNIAKIVLLQILWDLAGWV